MILSPSNSFCFVKTRKTGGTSIEMQLRTLTSAHDVVTPLLPAPEGLRNPEGRNWSGVFNPLGDVLAQWNRTGRGVRHLRGRGLYRPVRDCLRARRFYEHQPLDEIDRRSAIDLSGLFTFAFERNPWDKAISWWSWFNRDRLGTLGQDDFDRWLLDPSTKGFWSEWFMYSVDGEIAVDFLGQFEHLDRDLATALRRIGLPEPTASIPHEKRAPRGPGLRYRPETSRRIESIFWREIDHCGYRIPEELSW